MMIGVAMLVGRSRADSEVESREAPALVRDCLWIACRDRDSSQDRFCAGALVPLIILPSWKNRLWFTFATGGAFLFAIIPILSPPLVREMIAFHDQFGHSYRPLRAAVKLASSILPVMCRRAIKLVRDDLLFS